MAKYNAKGSIFKWTISAALTTIAQVRSIETDEAMPVIDSTDLSDTLRTYVAGLREPGTVVLELVFDPDGAGYLAIVADMWLGLPVAAQILWGITPVATESFSALPTKVRRSGSEGGLLVATIEFQVTTIRTIT